MRQLNRRVVLWLNKESGTANLSRSMLSVFGSTLQAVNMGVYGRGMHVLHTLSTSAFRAGKRFAVPLSLARGGFATVLELSHWSLTWPCPVKQYVPGSH